MTGHDEPVYVISVAAELAGVHPQTLRAYERCGLIRPRRSSGNVRRYSQRDIQRLTEVQRLTRQEGLNLAGVKMVLDLRDALEATSRRVAKLQHELVELSQRLRDEVEAAHRSHRFELAPLMRSDIELHPSARQRPYRPTHG